MTRTSKLFLAGLAATLTLGTAAFASPKGPMGHMGRLIEQLDLTPEQQAQAEALRDEGKAERESAHEQRSQMKQAIMAELESGEPNRRSIHKLLDDSMDAKRDAMHARADQMLDFYATLSPEQQATLLEEMAEMKERREDMHERRGEGRSRGEGQRKGPRGGGY